MDLYHTGTPNPTSYSIDAPTIHCCHCYFHRIRAHCEWYNSYYHLKVLENPHYYHYLLAVGHTWWAHTFSHQYGDMKEISSRPTPGKHLDASSGTYSCQDNHPTITVYWGCQSVIPLNTPSDPTGNGFYHPTFESLYIGLPSLSTRCYFHQF